MGCDSYKGEDCGQNKIGESRVWLIPYTPTAFRMRQMGEGGGFDLAAFSPDPPNYLSLSRQCLGTVLAPPSNCPYPTVIHTDLATLALFRISKVVSFFAARRREH